MKTEEVGAIKTLLLIIDDPAVAAAQPSPSASTGAPSRRLGSSYAHHALPTAVGSRQDPYSFRCIPQVHGAIRQTVRFAHATLEDEVNGVSDNPLFFPDDELVLCGGALHGESVAMQLDFLAIAAADLASISERRSDRFLDAKRNNGLPPFLADDPGVDSGHMIVQYMQAGVVAELKRLAAPASVDSIPSSAMQEDHVSLGWHAGRKLRRSVDGLTRVLAAEALTAARALDLRPDAPAPATAAVRDAIRAEVAGPGPDRFLAPEIESVVELVASGALVDAAEWVTGTLR